VAGVAEGLLEAEQVGAVPGKEGGMPMGDFALRGERQAVPPGKVLVATVVGDRLQRLESARNSAS
jgi:hypothetical protein